MNKIFGTALVIGLLVFTPRADAALKLSINDGDGAATIYTDADNDGVIAFFNSDGVFQTVGFGVSDPFFGTTTSPHLDIGIVGNASGAGTLTIMLTDTDFTTDSALNSFLGEISGSSAINSQVSIAAYLDDNNGEFALTTPICTAGPTTGTLLTCVNEIAATGSYSLTLMMIWETFGEGARISADGSIREIPEPSTLFLLGSGFVAIAGWSRRKLKKA